MSRVWVTGLPDPPEGKQWCAMCVMLAKGIINGQHAQEVAELAADGKDGDRWFSAREPFPLQAAQVRAMVAEMPQAGVLDVCWTHAAGITVKPQSPIAPANGPLPPGLIRGRG